MLPIMSCSGAGSWPSRHTGASRCIRHEAAHVGECAGHTCSRGDVRAGQTGGGACRRPRGGGEETDVREDERSPGEGIRDLDVKGFIDHCEKGQKAFTT